MNGFDIWCFESEAASRFYKSILALEDIWKWVSTVWKWRNYLWYQHQNRKAAIKLTNWPPVHNRTVWGDWVYE